MPYEYLITELRYKVCCEDRTEFEGDKGSVMLIVRDMFGLKSAGAIWRDILARVIEK